jgi:hypothetical protein
VEGRPQNGVVPGPVADCGRRSRARFATALSAPLRPCRPPAPCVPRASPCAAVRRRPRRGPPTPSRGTTSTAAIAISAPAAGTAVNQGDRSGPSTPTAITVPSTATAMKLTELLDQKEGHRAAGDPLPAHAALTQDPGAQGEATGAAGRHDRAGAKLRQADLPAGAPRHAVAEDGREQQHVRHTRHGLERHGQRHPLRPGLAQQVADLPEPRGERQHETDHREQPRRSRACAWPAGGARTRPASPHPLCGRLAPPGSGGATPAYVGSSAGRSLNVSARSARSTGSARSRPQ